MSNECKCRCDAGWLGRHCDGMYTCMYGVSLIIATNTFLFNKTILLFIKNEARIKRNIYKNKNNLTYVHK